MLLQNQHIPMVTAREYFEDYIKRGHIDRSATEAAFSEYFKPASPWLTRRIAYVADVAAECERLCVSHRSSNTIDNFHQHSILAMAIEHIAKLQHLEDAMQAEAGNRKSETMPAWTNNDDYDALTVYTTLRVKHYQTHI